MKRIAALRITGDICFFYAIISLLSIFDPWQRPMAIFAPLCLAAALAATGIRQAPLRFLLSLVPGACFLLAKPALSMVVPLLPWLYFILSLTLGRFHMEISDYRKAFRWMLGTCVILVVAYTVSSMLFGSKTVPVSSVAYLAAYLLLGVCALRWMQMGTTMDARWQGVNLLTIVTVLVAAVGVAVLVYQLFIHSRPVILFLIAPFRLLLKWLFGLFGRREFAEHHVQDLNPERSDSILPTGSAVFEDSTTAEDGDVEFFDRAYLDMNPLYRTDYAVAGLDYEITDKEIQYKIGTHYKKNASPPVKIVALCSLYHVRERREQTVISGKIGRRHYKQERQSYNDQQRKRTYKEKERYCYYKTVQSKKYHTAGKCRRLDRFSKRFKLGPVFPESLNIQTRIKKRSHKRQENRRQCSQNEDDITFCQGYSREPYSVCIFLACCLNLFSPAEESIKVGVRIRIKAYGAIDQNRKKIQYPYTPAVSDIIYVKQILKCCEKHIYSLCSNNNIKLKNYLSKISFINIRSLNLLC